LSSPSKLRFEEILKLVEYIPITGSLPSNGRFAKNTTTDSMFYFENLQRKGSFRDIVRVINTELAKIAGQQDILQREKQNAMFLDIEQRYKQLREIGCSYPVEYLLFDLQLARAMEPRNAESYIDTYGIRFRRRYEKYTEELRRESL
jgi:hypothetical protein